jgi:hypothetical protein
MVRWVLMEPTTRGINDSVVSHKIDPAEDTTRRCEDKIPTGRNEGLEGASRRTRACECRFSTCVHTNSDLQGVDSDLQGIDSDLRVVDSDLQGDEQ